MKFPLHIVLSSWMINSIKNNILGWEYAVETTFGKTNFEAVEKKYHFCRRRRLVRERQSVDPQKRDPALKVCWYRITLS